MAMTSLLPKSSFIGESSVLTGHVRQRHQVTQRLTLFYVLSLSAIAGLSIIGQLFIQRVLNHQSMDVEVIHTALEHKERVGHSIRGVRSLRRITDQVEKEAAVAELEDDLQAVQATWQAMTRLSPEVLMASNHRQHHTEDMLEKLQPSYDKAWRQLNVAFANAQQPKQKRAGASEHPPGKERPRIAPDSPRSHVRHSPGPQTTLARQAKTTQSLAPARPLVDIEKGYMGEIDEALEAYNQEMTHNVQRLQRLELMLLAVTLVVLVLEGAFIFRPAVSQTRDALSALALSLDETQQTAAQLASEQKKSEKLLLNILPQSIAQRLKQKHQPIADAFEEATVLFADIVGFTQLSTQIPPQELVQLLNQVFSAFDARVEQLGLEKIKTIGDAYMVVGGLPQPRLDHAEAIVDLAQYMQSDIETFNRQTGYSLSIRIGVNSGPVVAGVIGTKKFIYDLWGDTVNVASRMESHGQPGRIHLSESTQRLLGDRYSTQSRGAIEVKGKGATLTYWLNETASVQQAVA